MTKVRVHTVAIVASTAALTLTGCGGASSETSTPSSTATATSTSATTSTAASTSTAALPTDCATLGTEPTREEAIGDLTLQGNGDGFVRPAPAEATLALGCDWIVGDSTGLLLLISTAEPAAVTTAVAGLPAVGYTCQESEDYAAQFCDRPGAGPDTEEMVVARDDVWIYLSTSNRNGRAFLSDIVDGLFD